MAEAKKRKRYKHLSYVELALPSNLPISAKRLPSFLFCPMMTPDRSRRNFTFFEDPPAIANNDEPPVLQGGRAPGFRETSHVLSRLNETNVEKEGIFQLQLLQNCFALAHRLGTERIAQPVGDDMDLRFRNC